MSTDTNQESQAAQFWAAVEAAEESGMTRAAAIKETVKKHSALHKAAIAEANNR